jgi:hypothetical protein
MAKRAREPRGSRCDPVVAPAVVTATVVSRQEYETAIAAADNEATQAEPLILPDKATYSADSSDSDAAAEDAFLVVPVRDEIDEFPDEHRRHRHAKRLRFV